MLGNNFGIILSIKVRIMELCLVKPIFVLCNHLISFVLCFFFSQKHRYNREVLDTISSNWCIQNVDDERDAIIV